MVLYVVQVGRWTRSPRNTRASSARCKARQFRCRAYARQEEWGTLSVFPLFAGNYDEARLGPPILASYYGVPSPPFLRRAQPDQNLPESHRRSITNDYNKRLPSVSCFLCSTFQWPTFPVFSRLVLPSVASEQAFPQTPSNALFASNEFSLGIYTFWHKLFLVRAPLLSFFPEPTVTLKARSATNC